jgi:hypothetical protein
MRRFPSLLPAAVLLFVCLAANALAAPHWGVSAFTGYQNYSMDQINEKLALVDDALSRPGREAGIDRLNGDWSFSARALVDLNPTWRASVEYEYLKDQSGGGNTSIGNFQIKPHANAVMIGGTYFFPTTSRTRLGLGAGVGYYEFGGSVNSTVTWYTTTKTGSHNLGGNTIGYHLRAELDVPMSPGWHFDGALGYRWAKGNLETDDKDSGVDLDWSGLMTRIGISYIGI